MWECLCECGARKCYTGTNLRSGNTTSCGCARKERLVNYNHGRAADPWLADMTLYIRKLGYRKNRREPLQRGSNQFRKTEGRSHSEHPSLHWALTLEDYVRLVTAVCFYCGRAPNQRPQGVRAKNLRRNGIDRVDNSRGYEVSNCVPCCVSCNREKRAQSQEVFLENTRLRYEHLKTVGLL